MNTKKLFLLAGTFGLITWSCTNTNSDVTPTTVKSDMSQSATNVTNVVDSITSSPGFEILATSEQDMTGTAAANFVKAEAGVVPADSFSIVMADVAGTYTLTKATPYKYLFSYFNKDSITPTKAMVLLFPLARLKNLKVLLADTLKVNNKEIRVTVTDYHRHFRYLTGQSDYSMVSTVSKKGVQSGVYKVSRSYTGTGNSSNAIKTYTINNEFDFVSGHIAKCAFVISDTSSTSTYTLSDGSKTLFQEEFSSTKLAKAAKYSEKQYSLTFGNVKLVRKPKQSIDSTQIYLNNVLQTKAKITITKTVAFSNDSTENGITSGRRSIVVTFDDGTTANITTLTGAATMNKLKDLFAHLRKSYFGTYLVDQAAMNIYKVKKAGK